MSKKNFCLAVCLSMFLFAGAAMADGITMTYSGDPADFKRMNETSMGDRNVYPGDEGNASRSGNTVTVDYAPDADEGNVPGNVFGGLNDDPDEADDRAVTDNAVILKRGEVALPSDMIAGAGIVYGGYDNGNAGSGASGNAVTIDGADVIVTNGVTGGHSDGGPASGNTVTMNAGRVGVAVMGGSSSTDDATGNAVKISGGTVAGSIAGGASGADATGNAVTLSGNPDIAGATLIGGLSEGGGDVSGNTLNINGFTGAVKGVEDFETIKIFIPSGLEPDGTVLTVTEAVDLEGVKIEITGIEAGSALGMGDWITLISEVSGVLEDANITYSDGSKWQYTAAMGALTVGLMEDPSFFKKVTGITGGPAAATANIPLTLTGTVTPADATNKTIAWSLENAGTTGATLTNGILTATAAGSATVRATVAKGITPLEDYTQDFTITVKDADGNGPNDPNDPAVEQPLIDPAPNESELVYTVNADDTVDADLYLSLSSDIDLSKIEMVSADLSGIDPSAIAYAWAGADGVEHVIELAASRAIAPPYLKISFKAPNLAALQAVTLKELKYKLRGDDTIYTQTFDDENLFELKNVPPIDETPQKNPQGGGSGGCDAGAGVGSLVLAASLMATRRTRRR